MVGFTQPWGRAGERPRPADRGHSVPWRWSSGLVVGARLTEARPRRCAWARTCGRLRAAGRRAGRERLGAVRGRRAIYALCLLVSGWRRQRRAVRDEPRDRSAALCDAFAAGACAFGSQRAGGRPAPRVARRPGPGPSSPATPHARASGARLAAAAGGTLNLLPARDPLGSPSGWLSQHRVPRPPEIADEPESSGPGPAPRNYKHERHRRPGPVAGSTRSGARCPHYDPMANARAGRHQITTTGADWDRHGSPTSIGAYAGQVLAAGHLPGREGGPLDPD
jgi:hypothetical protein